MSKVLYDEKGQPIYDKERFASYADFQKAAEADLSTKMKATPAATPRKDTGVLGMMGRAGTSALPSIGGLAGEMTPAGPVGAALGGAGGSIIANKLRQASPDYFGEPSNNTGMSALTDGILQGIFGGGAKALAGGLAKAIPTEWGGTAIQDLIGNMREPNLMGKKVMPLTRNSLGQFNKAQYAKSIGAISTLARVLSTMGSVPENPANIPPGN